MVAVMDIAMLLERLRDAFLADKNSLVGKNESLPLHFINDIDMAFRVCMTQSARHFTFERARHTLTSSFPDRVRQTHTLK